MWVIQGGVGGIGGFELNACHRIVLHEEHACYCNVRGWSFRGAYELPALSAVAEVEMYFIKDCCYQDYILCKIKVLFYKINDSCTNYLQNIKNMLKEKVKREEIRLNRFIVLQVCIYFQ